MPLYNILVTLHCRFLKGLFQKKKTYINLEFQRLIIILTKTLQIYPFFTEKNM